MAENSAIEWTDHTWNPWRGCEHATLPDGSPHSGCLHCYAEAWSERNPATLGVWGAADGLGRRVVAAEPYWKLPHKWNEAAKKDGVRKKVFCASMADLFEDWVGPMTDVRRRRLWVSRAEPIAGYIPETAQGSFTGCRPLVMSDLRRRVFDTIDATQWLDWILLTKRLKNVPRMWPYLHKSVGANVWVGGPSGHDVVSYRPNVWLVASVSDQPSFDATVSAMQELHGFCPVRGLSAEPLVGPIDWRAKIPPYYAAHFRSDRINWLILGGESGSDARACEIDWIRSGVHVCRETEIPAFVKQMGARPVTRLPDHERWPGHSGPLSAVQFEGDGYGRYFVHGLRDKKGGDPTEWPEDLRVREWPR